MSYKNSPWGNRNQGSKGYPLQLLLWVSVVYLFTGKTGIGMHIPHWKQTQAFSVATLHMEKILEKPSTLPFLKLLKIAPRLGYSHRLTWLNNVSSSDGWKVPSRLVRTLCTTLDTGTRFWQASRDSFKEWSKDELVWMVLHWAENSIFVVFYNVRKLLWATEAG